MTAERADEAHIGGLPGEPSGAPSAPVPRPARLPRRLGALVARHPLFTVIILIGAGLRGVAMLGYPPAMYFNDTFDYIHAALDPYPHPLRPDGYSFLLFALKPFHSFLLVTGVQHLLGLAMGVMIYATLRHRFRLPGWGAALAAAPVLLDGYQIQLEHLILSDTLFAFLVVSAVTLLLWRDRPGPGAAAVLGLLLAWAWLTRTLGLPVLLGVCVYLLLRRVGWRALAVTLTACAVPVVAYMSWFAGVHGQFSMTSADGVFLFARAYKFADCHKIPNLTAAEQQLCVQPAHKLPNSQDGIWDRRSPLKRVRDQRFGPEQNAVAGSFSRKAIMAQPGDYLRVVAKDFLRSFRWDRPVFPDPKTFRQYEFKPHEPPLPMWRMANGKGPSAAGVAIIYEGGRARTMVVEPYAEVIRVYQDHVYLRGTLLGGLLLVGLAGMVRSWRRFGGAAFLPWSLATGLLLAPAATVEFDYRYVLPAVPLASLAAGIACAQYALSRRSRSSSSRSSV